MDPATLQKVRDAVQQAFSQGKTPDEVRQFMLNAGYSEAEIAEIMPGAPQPSAYSAPPQPAYSTPPQAYSAPQPVRPPADPASFSLQPSQPALTANPKPSFASRLNFKIIAIVGLLCVFILIGSVLLKPVSSPSSPAIEPPGGLQPAANATLPSATPPANEAVDAATREFVKGYAGYVTAAAVGAADPMNLDAASKSSLSSIRSAVSSGTSSIIFNGKAYSDIETVKRGTTHYLRPKGFTGPESEYLPIISEDESDLEAMLSAPGSRTESQILRMFYESMKSGKSASETYSALQQDLKSYLDSQVSSGVLAGYEIKADFDEISLAYSGETIPFTVSPYHHVSLVGFVMDSYGDPAAYASSALAEYKSRIAQGYVLAVNTKTDPAYFEFFDGARLSREMGILLDDSMSSDAKLDELAGPIRLAAQPAGVTPSGGAVAASQPGYAKLLETPGVIVPPSKKIFYWEGPDNRAIAQIYTELGLAEPAYLSVFSDISNPTGPLKPYYEAGYTIHPAFPGWDEHTVEALEEKLSDSDYNTVILSTHGGDNNLEAEVYFLGQNGSVKYGELKAAFENRIAQLKAAYGDTAIRGSRVGNLNLNQEVARQLINSRRPNLPLGVKRFLIDDAKEAVIQLKGPFFSRFPKKSFVILLACHGGSMASDIQSRDLLACDPKTELTLELAVSDLKKISPYLSKDLDPGSIQLSNGVLRNYDILSRFTGSQISGASGETSFDNAERSCSPKKDTLCMLKLYGSTGQTVSPSPHVEHADASKITFNAPMDTAMPAEGAVTLDYSQCLLSPAEEAELIPLKPAWAGDPGKEITLPWLDKAYRDWTIDDTEIASLPKAKITVSNARAWSAISGVYLTGNPDCCTASGCSQPECWREPAAFQYNANTPKTDFVYFMPCKDAGYYEACDKETSPTYIKIVTPDGKYPSFVKSKGKDYKKSTNPEARSQAELVNDWKPINEEDSTCGIDLVYTNCGGSYGMDLIKLKYTQAMGPQPPIYIKRNHVCYMVYPEPTAAQLESAHSVADGDWKKGDDCAMQCIKDSSSCKMRVKISSDGLSQEMMFYLESSRTNLKMRYGAYPENADWAGFTVAEASIGGTLTSPSITYAKMLMCGRVPDGEGGSCMRCMDLTEFINTLADAQPSTQSPDLSSAYNSQISLIGTREVAGVTTMCYSVDVGAPGFSGPSESCVVPDWSCVFPLYIKMNINGTNYIYEAVEYESPIKDPSVFNAVNTCPESEYDSLLSELFKDT